MTSTKKNTKRTSKKARRNTYKQAISYQEACRQWCKADYWPLEDAVNLLIGLKPSFLGENTLDPKKELQRDIVYQLALNSLGEHLPAIPSIGDTEMYRVRPHEFLAWAELRFSHIPRELREAVDEATKTYKRGLVKGLRPDQRYRERCRAIAILLWQQFPNETKADMAKRPEFLEIGCEGYNKSIDTIMDWIKDLNPDRRPGRRAKK